MKRIIYLLTCIVIIASCGSAESNNLPERDSSDNPTSGDTSAGGSAAMITPQTQDTAKLDGNWFLVAILPSDTAAGRVPSINFDMTAKTFTGNTGCNSMRGTFSFNDSTIQINEQIITTKMACPGYNEDAFLKNLPRTNKHRFENGMLILMMDGTELSRWTRTKMTPETIKAT
jgi:heat shock protein HslJ